MIRRPRPRIGRTPNPLQRLGIRLYNAGARALNVLGNFLATSQTDSGFAAARWNRVTAEWTVWRRSADQEILSDLGALRARARNLVLNNPFAKRFVSQVAQNVAGPYGFRFKPKVQLADGTLDQRTNQEIARAWADWCRRDTCSVDGKLSFRALQRLVMNATPQDGEVLVRMVEGFPNDYGFALQVIDADLLDEQYNAEPGPNGNEIRMGIEIDEWGRPLGYYLWDRHPGEVARKRERKFVPARELLHLYIPFRVGQSRGVPWFHAIMLDLKHLDEYAEAELVAARTAAAKMGFFTTTEEGAAAWQPPQQDAEGIERIQLEVEPGLLSQMPPGLEFQSWDPQHPNQAYKDFVKAVLRGAASGLDVCYHNLTGDLEGVNYSSARVGELDERDVWRALQQWLCEELHQRVYERWLAMALLTNRVRLPTQNVADYRSVAWLPRGWAWVDPENDLNAMEKAIQLGLTSRTIEAAAQGRDLEEVFVDLDQEQDLAKEYGISITAPVKGSPALVDEGTSAAAGTDRALHYRVPPIHVDVAAPEVKIENIVQPPDVRVVQAPAPEVRIENIIQPIVVPAPIVQNILPARNGKRRKVTLQTARGAVTGEIEEVE